jgi:1-acyl-sn-glycerol-3-phosphate acyltransferase
MWPLNSAPGRTPAPRLDRPLLEKHVVPLMRRFIDAGYFGLEVHGKEHIPADGRAVFAPNHAGWFPLDAFFLGMAVREALGPSGTPFFAVTDAATSAPVLGPFLQNVGALPASWFRRPERLPPEIRTCGIFPEGVEGNCKPFWEAYRMRPWKRGFVRVASALGVPIVPVAIVGGEECLPVAWTVRLFEPLIGSIFGLPLTPVPLPTRWRIHFHAPVDVASRGRAALVDAEFSASVARETQRTVQATLDREARRQPLAQLGSLVSLARGEAPPEAEPAPGPGRQALAVSLGTRVARVVAARRHAWTTP